MTDKNPRRWSGADQGVSTRKEKTKMPANNAKRKSWRDVLKIHPAAEMFPLMSAEELKALGEDIRKHGLTSSIITWSPTNKMSEEPGFEEYLLDGRNRLDAIEMLGVSLIGEDGRLQLDGFAGKIYMHHQHIDEEIGSRKHQNLLVTNPYEYVVSANIHRRHLTEAQRIELLEKIIKANPQMSSRRAAKLAQVSPTTAVKSRRQLEAKGDVSIMDTSIDTKGRKQPASKPPKEITVRPVGKLTTNPPGKLTVAHKSPVIACADDVQARVERVFESLGRHDRGELLSHIERFIADLRKRLKDDVAVAATPAGELPDMPEGLRRH